MNILVLGWAVAANWLAYKRGFYRLPPKQNKTLPLVTTFQLIICALIYFLFTTVIVQVLLNCCGYLLQKRELLIATTRMNITTGLQVFIMSSLFGVLQWFLRAQDKESYRKIWKDRDHIPASSGKEDFLLGVRCWIISFPIVSVVGTLIDLIGQKLFHVQDFEQNAVKFVKLAMNDPLSLILAVLSVLVAAPLLEEFVFRGLFQTYLKTRLGPKAAILLSAMIFALFHFAPGHGLGNIMLIFSLLILGIYLGFLYERQGSLLAPIGLHATFNLVSALRIIFFPEIT